MDIFIYSDESGVFDKKNNQFFAFGGLMFLSFAEVDDANRLYKNAEFVAKKRDGIPADCEAKACCLSNGSKAKLFRSLNKFHKFGVVVHQELVLPRIFDNKKTKQRYLDYVFKIAVKRKFQALIRQGVIDPLQVGKLRFFVDEHATATDGRYELREALEQEFKIGTFNWRWDKFHEPIFPRLQSVELSFCDSQTRSLIRAADIVANKIYYAAVSRDLSMIRDRENFHLIELP